MVVYSSAYLIYGIQLESPLLKNIIANEERSYFNSTDLAYINPTEYMCAQYTSILGLKLAELDECNNPTKIVIPVDLEQRYFDVQLLLFKKLREMHLQYETKEYDCDKEELVALRSQLESIFMTEDPKPALFLAIRKL
jgi:hypothetical protein